jgi:ABC-type spermidine/putrescine transport system permease subunit II
MKIDINADEARMVLNHRAWERLFKTKRTGWAYFSVMSPPVIVVFSTALLFTNANNVVPSICLAFGLLCLPFTFKALKRFKVLQTEVQAEMIKEEKKGVTNG